jgi:hypothetical protein
MTVAEKIGRDGFVRFRWLALTLRHPRTSPRSEQISIGVRLRPEQLSVGRAGRVLKIRTSVPGTKKTAKSSIALAFARNKARPTRSFLKFPKKPSS